MKSDERPRTVRPTNPAHQIKFNDEMAADVFEVVDVKGDRHGILSMVDMATHYHVAVRVSPGGTPPSKVCAEAINSSWCLGLERLVFLSATKVSTIEDV